jgi:hypothetical protein
MILMISFFVLALVSTCSNLNNDMYTIDLHGLHAGEALEFLTQRIKFLTHSKANSATPRKQEITLKIIVGIGRHQSANTVLGPTVNKHFCF